MYNRTVLKNGSCCTVRPGKVSCLQKFRHFWMIIRDLFFESGSTEAIKIKKILQRYVIYISDQITVPYLNTETGNRRLNIVDGMFSLEERVQKSNFSPLILKIMSNIFSLSDEIDIDVFNARKI